MLEGDKCYVEREQGQADQEHAGEGIPVSPNEVGVFEQRMFQRWGQFGNVPNDLQAQLKLRWLEKSKPESK